MGTRRSEGGTNLKSISLYSHSAPPNGVGVAEDPGAIDISLLRSEAPPDYLISNPRVRKCSSKMGFVFPKLKPPRSTQRRSGPSLHRGKQLFQSKSCQFSSTNHCSAVLMLVRSTRGIAFESALPAENCSPPESLPFAQQTSPLPLSGSGRSSPISLF